MRGYYGFESKPKLLINWAAVFIVAVTFVTVQLSITNAVGSVSKAKKLEKNGQLDPAFDELIETLQNDPGNKDGNTYLQYFFPILMKHHQTILNAFLNNYDWPNSCIEYRKISAILAKGKNFGVNVASYEFDQNKMMKACESAAEKYYQEGRISFDKGEVQKAMVSFMKVLEFEKPYKDTEDYIQKCKAYR